MRQPHSIVVDPARGWLLICDIGNHRVRRVELATGTIDTFAGTGGRQPTPDGAPLAGTPLNGPRTLAIDARGNLYLALREGNAILRVDVERRTFHHVAGTGAQGYSGDGGAARAATLSGPKGLAWGRDALFVADTENHVIRRVALDSGMITTVLGTGQRGDGPGARSARLRAGAAARGAGRRPRALYVADSEAHRIRVLE